MSVSSPEPQKTPEKRGSGAITIVGLLLFVAGLVVARAVHPESDPHLGTDIGDILKSFGAALAAVGGPVPLVDWLRRGLGSGGAKILAAGTLGGALALLSLLGGCAALERREVACTTAPESVLEDLPDGRCALRGYCDGHELWTAIGPGPCGEVEER